MKLYLCFALLFIGTYAVQVPNNEAESKQADNQPQVNRLLNSKMLNLLTKKTTAVDQTDPLAAVTAMYQFYLDDDDFTNNILGIFLSADADRNLILTNEEYSNNAAQEIGSDVDAERLWKVVAHKKDAIGFAQFKELAELVLHEQVGLISYVFITGSSQHSRADGLTLEQLEQALTLIFTNLEGGYPLPRCQELSYLFQRCDINGDLVLNVEETFYLLSIFLRFYKSGVKNNLYGAIVLTDNLFELLWRKEDLEAQHTEKLEVFDNLFYTFFALAIDEKGLNQLGHKLFTQVDQSGDGAIQDTELNDALSLFGATEAEVALLYAGAEKDEEGRIEFSEFLILFESFVHRAASKFGYSLINELGHEVDLSLTYTLFYDALKAVKMRPISDDVYTTLFDSADEDGNAALDLNEFSKLDSAIISYVRLERRKDINSKIEAQTGTTPSTKNINKVYEQQEREQERNDDQVTNNDLADQMITAAVQGEITTDVREVAADTNPSNGEQPTL